MKTSVCTAMMMLGSAAKAFAAGGAEYEGVSVLMILFMGFSAMIISFQVIMVAMLLISMVKAIFSKPVEEDTEPVAEHNGQGS